MARDMPPENAPRHGMKEGMERRTKTISEAICTSMTLHYMLAYTEEEELWHGDALL